MPTIKNFFIVLLKHMLVFWGCAVFSVLPITFVMSTAGPEVKFLPTFVEVYIGVMAYGFTGMFAAGVILTSWKLLSENKNEII